MKDMKDETCEMIEWSSHDNGFLKITGSGKVRVSTIGRTAELSCDGKVVNLLYCDGCDKWLHNKDGIPSHDDDQTVQCVLKS